MDNLYNHVWEEKYRPKNIEDVILPERVKNTFRKYIQRKEFPNLLLSSKIPGLGKTTVAQVLCNEIGAEYMYINASEDGGIDLLRNEIGSFSMTKSFMSDAPKIIHLDEFDKSSNALQEAMRSPMEEYIGNVRFILTCNNVNKITHAIKSRCTHFDFTPSSKEDRKNHLISTAKRLAYILDEEGVHYSKEVLGELVKSNFPEIRKSIKLLQQFSDMNNKVINQEVLQYNDIDDELIEYINKKDWTKARKYCVDNNIGEEIYTFLYNNYLPTIFNKKELFAKSLMIIDEYQFKSSMVLDKEIPLASCLMELIRLV